MKDRRFILQKKEGITVEFMVFPEVVRLIYRNVWAFTTNDKKKIVDKPVARELWKKLLKEGYKRVK